MVQYYIPEKKAAEEKSKMEKKKKDEIYSWSIFFGVLLTVVLITLYEKTMLDLPRFFNPYYQDCHRANLILCETIKYEAARLFLFLAIVAPLLVIALILYLAGRKKPVKSQSKILKRAYYISVLVVASHLFIAFALFLFRHYREIGVYVILGCFALTFIILIIWLQRRHNRPKEGIINQ
ncbi:MAG: hypothetical protein WC528_01685 [Patescibacteria group bacterium]